MHGDLFNPTAQRLLKLDPSTSRWATDSGSEAGAGEALLPFRAQQQQQQHRHSCAAGGASSKGRRSEAAAASFSPAYHSCAAPSPLDAIDRQGLPLPVAASPCYRPLQAPCVHGRCAECSAALIAPCAGYFNQSRADAAAGHPLAAATDDDDDEDDDRAAISYAWSVAHHRVTGDDAASSHPGVWNVMRSSVLAMAAITALLLLLPLLLPAPLPPPPLELLLLPLLILLILMCLALSPTVPSSPTSSYPS